MTNDYQLKSIKFIGKAEGNQWNERNLCIVKLRIRGDKFTPRLKFHNVITYVLIYNLPT